MSNEIAWEPTAYHTSESNIAKFIAEYGYEYDELIPETEQDLAGVWDAMIKDVDIVWREGYEDVVDTSDGAEFAHWFQGGRLNATETILDQWADQTPDRPMYAWEDEQHNAKTVTYAEMRDQVNRLANAMRDQGVEQGDVVGLIFPMHPLGFAAALACLRLGAVFTMIFPGYGAEAMAHRLNDAGATMLVAADGYQRNGSTTNLLEKIDNLLTTADSIDDVIVYQHIGINANFQGATMHGWDDTTTGYSTEIEPVVVDADEPAFIAYSSGTTGMPKGTIHTHASLLAMGNKESRYHFDLSEGDTLLWVTDFGWIIVPVWMLAGGPALGATTVLLEGGPAYPDKDRIWQAIERYGVTTFGISPTGARNLHTHRESPRDAFDLSSLQVLGSTGEPWDEDGWQWFLEAVGNSECPIINASGGTELAGAILAPTPVNPLKSGTLYGPAPGIAANIVDENGDSADTGYLVVELPFPGMTHSLTSGDDRYLEEYWSDFEGKWNQNDWAERDADGFWFITGRADDTMNIAGRRITAPAIEETIEDHPAIHEATVVPVPDKQKGQIPVAFVTLTDNSENDEEITTAVTDLVAENLGAPFRPAAVHVVSGLPRTQTGKIPRGVLEATYLGDSPDDTSMLANAHLLNELPRR